MRKSKKTKLKIVANTFILALGLKAVVSEASEFPIGETLFYEVQEGDNLTEISKRYGKSIEDIVKVNKIKDRNYIQVGERINVTSIGYANLKK